MSSVYQNPCGNASGETVWNDDADLEFTCATFGPKPGSPNTRIDKLLGEVEALTVAELLTKLGLSRKAHQLCKPITGLKVSTVLRRALDLIAIDVSEELGR